jgi:hypothetical protein
MAKRDYVPHEEGEFYDWVKNLVAYATAHYQGWSVPCPAGTLAQPLQAFTAAYEQFLDPNHGKVDTERKNETKAALVHLVRQYCQAWIMHNPNVTDDDRLEMGLPLYDTTRTPSGEPDTRPMFKVLIHDIRQIKLEISDFESTRIAIPERYDGAVVYWGFLDRPPVSPEELIKSTLATHAHFMLTFNEEDRGKTVYVAVRWQKGELKGPWSEIIGLIVP